MVRLIAFLGILMLVLFLSAVWLLVHIVPFIICNLGFIILGLVLILIILYVTR